MKSVRVHLGQRSYKIYVGAKLLGKVDQLMPTGKGPYYRGNTHYVVVCEKRLKDYGDEVLAGLKRAKKNAESLYVSGGEGIKDLDRLLPIYNKLFKKGVARHSILVVVGGGALGDAMGFLAATYMRGLRLVSIPTTLLSQVDSAIGGKTAVNHSSGKNLIGAFYQPSLVLCDVNTLTTLPKRDIVSGLGEVIKYGLCFDPRLYHYTVDHWQALLNLSTEKMVHVIQKSIKHKVKVVEEDEKDLLGLREQLNFGHTFAHALEKCAGMGKFRHGEAVIFGMMVSVTLSSIAQKDQVLEFLREIPIPNIPSKVSCSQLIKVVSFDKKNTGKGLRFISLKKMGETRVSHKVTSKAFKEVLLGLGVRK